MSAVQGPGDAASASVFVEVAPDVAFDVFTREIDLWWRQGPRYRIAGRRKGQLSFEPGVGGRLFETLVGPSGTSTFVVGRVTAWDPPSSLELEWRGVNFKPHETTFVAVRFEPKRDGTLVTVRHSGWSALPGDHPARHGLNGAAFSRMIGLWWGDLMTSLREHAASRDLAGEQRRPEAFSSGLSGAPVAQREERTDVEDQGQEKQGPEPDDE